VVAGVFYAILALAAVVRSPDSDGLRTAVVQLGGTFLAAALGVVSLGGSSSDDRSGSRLASLGIFVAWLSLLGLPPTLGFHGKLLVYQSLLQADWGWLAVAAMAGTAGALVPAFRVLAAPARRDVTKSRAILIALLVAAVALLGVYPQTALSVTALLTSSG
jgi:NADH-quinone oxidoreductase subunit N